MYVQSRPKTKQQQKGNVGGCDLLPFAADLILNISSPLSPHVNTQHIPDFARFRAKFTLPVKNKMLNLLLYILVFNKTE